MPSIGSSTLLALVSPLAHRGTTTVNSAVWTTPSCLNCR